MVLKQEKHAVSICIIIFRYNDDECGRVSGVSLWYKQETYLALWVLHVRFSEQKSFSVDWYAADKIYGNKGRKHPQASLPNDVTLTIYQHVLDLIFCCPN